MKRITEEDLTLHDATGEPVPPRVLGLKLADTVIRSVGVAVVLVAIGRVWEAFH
jgi:hypothetical protein